MTRRMSLVSMVVKATLSSPNTRMNSSTLFQNLILINCNFKTIKILSIPIIVSKFNQKFDRTSKFQCLFVRFEKYRISASMMRKEIFREMLRFEKKIISTCFVFFYQHSSKISSKSNLFRSNLTFRTRYYPERLRDFPDCINTRQYHSFNLLRPGWKNKFQYLIFEF